MQEKINHLQQQLMNPYLIKLQKLIFGKQMIVIVRDLTYILNNKQSLAHHKQTIDKCQTTMKQNAGATFALALGLNLSAQRYFPNTFGALTANKILFDLIIAGLALYSGFSITINSLQNQIKYLKRDLLFKYDQGYIKEMKKCQKYYDISYKFQVGHVMKSYDEYQSWRKDFQTKAQVIL